MSRSNNNPNTSDNLPTESYFERYRRIKLEGKGELSKKDKEPLKRLKNASDKRAKQNAEYNRLAKQFKIDNPYCVGRLEGCLIKTNHVHHSKGKIGALLTDLRYFIPLCEHCHHLVHQFPKMALELNLSVLRLKKDD